MQMTPIDTASATEVSGTIQVRLGAKLKVAPENVRANSKPRPRRHQRTVRLHRLPRGAAESSGRL